MTPATVTQHCVDLIVIDDNDDNDHCDDLDSQHPSLAQNGIASDWHWNEGYKSPAPPTSWLYPADPALSDEGDLIHLHSDDAIPHAGRRSASPEPLPQAYLFLPGYTYDPVRPSPPSPAGADSVASSEDDPSSQSAYPPPTVPPALTMATQQSTTSTTWEQGGARPNPLYPSHAPFERYRASKSPRLSTPADVRRAEASDKLQQGILNSWRGSEPTPETTAAIVALLARLTALVNKEAYRDNPRGDRYRVDVFGSVSWGGETKKSSDLDLVIVDTRLLYGYIPSLWKVPVGMPSLGGSRGARTPQNDKVPLAYDMYWLANKLRAAPGFSEVQSITKANTPIVKFNIGGLECDINCNDMGGWYNSLLIQAYARVSPYVFRPMIYALKKWAAEHNLNDYAARKSTPTTMSSYCLTLMAIAYLQHIGALPNLQKGVVVPRVCDPSDPRQRDTIWISWGREQGQIARIWFNQDPPADWRSRHPYLTAAQAVFGFFRFYSGLRGEKDVFDPSTQFVSILNGGVATRPRPPNTLGRERQEFRKRMHPDTPKDEIVRLMAEFDDDIDREEKYMGTGVSGIIPRRWDEKRLIVQDPFIWDKNCAAGISKDGLDRFFKTVVASYRLLEDADTSFNDLLAIKV